MVDLQVTIDRVVSCVSFVRQCFLPDWQPNVTLAAGVAIAGGFVAALWGARLLRAFFVAAFMVAGAAIGVHLARRFDIELLVGIVLGAGVLGLVGHLLFRWWIGIGTGLCTALVIAVVGTPWIWSEVESFSDNYLTPGSGIRIAGAAEGVPAIVGQRGSSPAVVTSAFWQAFGSYLWSHQYVELRRLLVLAGIAALLGTVLGLVLPRFTTAMGTAIIGIGMVVTGGAVLVIRNQRAWWDAAVAKPDWFLGGFGLAVLIAFAFQIRHRRRSTVSAEPAEPAPAA